MKKRLVTILLGFLTISVPLFAHHGAATYDTTKKLTMKGTVTEWFWANPHCFLKFDKGRQRQVCDWAAEASNPSDMVNPGWTKQTFKPGRRGYYNCEPVKNGLPIGRVHQVVLANGQILKGRVAI